MIEQSDTKEDQNVCPECEYKPHPVQEGDTSVLQAHWDWCSQAKLGNKYNYDFTQLDQHLAGHILPE